MKYFIALLLLISISANAQTGDLICDFNTFYDSNYDEIEMNLNLKSENHTYTFEIVNAYDTLKYIEAGNYMATIYSSDSSFIHREEIVIEGNSINYFNYWSDLDYYAYEYKKDSFHTKIPNNRSAFYAGYDFAKGIHNLEDPNHLKGNYSTKFIVQADFLFGRSPFGFGLEQGIEYNHAFLDKIDFVNPAITHQRQQLSYLNYYAALSLPVYIRGYKILDFGAQYHLPLRTRLSQKDGSQKTVYKNIHNFNDVRLFARVGFAFGFVFAEYRTVQFIKAPFDDLPKLNIGIRINMTEIEEY